MGFHSGFKPEMVETNVERFDFIRMDAAPKRLPNGFLSLTGRVAKTGVLEYHRADGSVRRELRHPDDVFHADSLASLAGIPITVDHHGRITSANIARHGVGHVVGAGQRDGDAFVVAPQMTVQRQDAVADVEARKLVELSCGYACRFDGVPGEWGGQAYDGRQTMIRYDHLAMGPDGWGRSGPEVRIRMDSAVAQFEDGARWDHLVVVPADLEAKEDGDKAGERKMAKKNITIGRLSFPVEVPDELMPNLESELATVAQERQDSADQVTKLTAERDGLAADKTKLTGELAEAKDPAKIEAAAAERSTLVQDAKMLAPELDPAGMDTKAVHVAALVANGEDQTRMDSHDAPYLAGLFAGAVKAKAGREDSSDDKGKGPRSTGPDPTPGKKTSDRQDADDNSPAARHAAMRKRGAEAWKTGMAKGA